LHFVIPSTSARLAAALRAGLPGIPVTASHEALPVFREYERTSTTTAEGTCGEGSGIAENRDDGEQHGVKTCGS